jgi:hypothetical protein
MTYVYANDLLSDCWTPNHPYIKLYSRYSVKF